MNSTNEQPRASDNPLDALRPMDAPLGIAHGIAAVALTLAMKFHDINTVQDGTLYQQYKLEGMNLCPLHIDMVFETAIRIERHLLASSDRIAGLIVDAIDQGIAPNQSQNSDLDIGAEDGDALPMQGVAGRRDGEA